MHIIIIPYDVTSATTLKTRKNDRQQIECDAIEHIQ